MSALYENIMSMCEKRGVSAYRMCRDIGIQPSIVSDLKAGRKKSLSARVAVKIADYFEISVSLLLDGEKAGPKTGEVSVQRDRAGGIIGFDDFTYAMADESKDLTDGDKEVLLAMARALKEKNEKKG